MNQAIEPHYTLKLPQSVAMLCLQCLRKFPLEQVEQAYGVLMNAIEYAEAERRAAERKQILDDELEKASNQ